VRLVGATTASGCVDLVPAALGAPVVLDPSPPGVAEPAPAAVREAGALLLLAAFEAVDGSAAGARLEAPWALGSAPAGWAVMG
jgi:hypothetical protein